MIKLICVFLILLTVVVTAARGTTKAPTRARTPKPTTPPPTDAPTTDVDYYGPHEYEYPDDEPKICVFAGERKLCVMLYEEDL
jgi:hypothetical protein